MLLKNYPPIKWILIEEISMRYLVFNSKGGFGKSLITREIIAAPFGKDIVIAEIDSLNKTQQPYINRFKTVIELNKEEIKDLLIYLNEHDNIVIDVGVDNLSATLQKIVEYSIFDDIDKVVIPLGLGRSDSENALKTYNVISKHCDKIIFAFTNFNQDKSIESQYPVFFSNVSKVAPNFTDKDYVTINASSIFHDAQHDKKLVIEMAKEVDHKSAAIAAKKEGNINKFRDLMQLELNKRAAQILVKQCIMPAHEKIIR